MYISVSVFYVYICYKHICFGRPTHYLPKNYQKKNNNNSSILHTRTCKLQSSKKFLHIFTKRNGHSSLRIRTRLLQSDYQEVQYFIEFVSKSPKVTPELFIETLKGCGITAGELVDFIKSTTRWESVLMFV